MFGNIIRKSSTTLARFFNQPVLAVAGGKSINHPQFNKNFIDYALPGSGLGKDSQDEFDQEVKSTNKGTDENEQQERRNDPQSGANAEPFKEPVQSNPEKRFGHMGVPNRRQEAKWAEDGEKKLAEKQGQSWARQAENIPKGKL